MKPSLAAITSLGVALALAGAARADNRYGVSVGFPGGYAAWSSRPAGGYYAHRDPVHSHHPSRRGHIDYVPGHYHRHGNHYHYVPPHYDYHYRGRRYELTPGPYPGTWGTSPWHHHRD
jgi:hypothetical protein